MFLIIIISILDLMMKSNMISIADIWAWLSDCFQIYKTFLFVLCKLKQKSQLKKIYWKNAYNHTNNILTFIKKVYQVFIIRNKSYEVKI